MQEDCAKWLWENVARHGSHFMKVFCAITNMQPWEANRRPYKPKFSLGGRELVFARCPFCTHTPYWVEDTCAAMDLHLKTCPQARQGTSGRLTDWRNTKAELLSAREETLTDEFAPRPDDSK